MIQKPKIAVFRNRDTEAEFWEKSIDSVWEKGRPVKVKFAKNLSETINVRFDAQTLTEIGNEAKKKGLGTTQLIRMWVMERLAA